MVPVRVVWEKDRIGNEFCGIRERTLATEAADVLPDLTKDFWNYCSNRPKKEKNHNKLRMISSNLFNKNKIMEKGKI